MSYRVMDGEKTREDPIDFYRKKWRDDEKCVRTVRSSWRNTNSYSINNKREEMCNYYQKNDQ